MGEEEEMEEFVRESYEVEEIDMDYEFDAARFYDFGRLETDFEAREAERWFESAGNYPPSPFIIKLNRRKCIPAVVVNTSAPTQSRDMVSQSKTKSTRKSTLSRSSTLMKPTASHLARLNQLHLFQSLRSLRLKKKLGNIDDKSSQNSSVTDDLATKRQKLEAGYLRQGAQLKHQALWLHKVPKKLGGVTGNGRPKATLPREPALETAHRAERRWYKINAESSEEAKSNACTFKAYPLNRKILMSPSLPLTRRIKPQLPEFKVFRLQTSERATQNKLNNETNMPYYSSSLQKENTEDKRSNSERSFRQEKRQTIYNLKPCSPHKKKHSCSGIFSLSPKAKRATTVTRGIDFSTDKRIQDEPPIYLFSKLCITKTQSTNTNPLLVEGTRQKTPGSFQGHEMGNVVKERSQRLLGGKSFEYRGCDRRIPNLQLFINRSLDIR